MKENTQMGVEHMGDDSAAADAEILAMTVECLKAAGLTEFQVSVGQVDYYKIPACRGRSGAGDRRASS